MTEARERLDRAARRVHTLLGWIAELERRPTGEPVLLACAHRGLREASRELSDAAYLFLLSVPRPRAKRRAKWEVSAGNAA